MMKLVKNSAGRVVSYGPDDEHYEPVIPDGCTVEVLEDEAALTAINQPPTNAEKIIALKAELVEMEKEAIMPRSQRETNIQLLTALAPSLGYNATQLAALPAMVGWKADDAKAKQLRDQIKALST